MPPAAARHDRLDALRGCAIVWMAVYHFCFDLNHFGLLEPRQRFNVDPFWVTQRTAIVTLFLFCAGVGQAMAVAAGQSAARFWRRWAQVAGCALLVSAGSALMFPRSWIAFGVLHGIAAMLLVSRALAAGRIGPGAMAGLAVVALALPSLAAHPVFDHPLLQWTGLVTRKPVTEDYVPVFPWLGVMLAGLAGGQWALAQRPGWVQGPLPRSLGPLAVLGRWSLSFYMLHQPLFIGALMGVTALTR